MIVVKDIDFYSLCEHHILPFFGKAHVAYIPRGRIVGYQQDRAPGRGVRAPPPGAGAHDDPDRRARSSELLEPLGVAVVLEAEHLCMRMRGVEKQNSTVVTSAMRGAFQTNSKTREEFMTFIRPR